MKFIEVDESSSGDPLSLPTSDFDMDCSVCGKFLGVMSMSYFGVPHHTPPVMCCRQCLPKRLELLEKEGYDPEKIAEVRTWLEEADYNDKNRNTS